jgi:phosphatidylinositol-3-phosphatase
MRKFLRDSPFITLAAVLALPLALCAQAPLPRPDHVVVVIFENHGYGQIIGSADAPYINAFATDDHSAVFTQSFAIAHPSQPNYIDLYSGCNQGVLLDFLPLNYPFTTANLGRQLIDSGLTWATYSEDLPSVGWDGQTNGGYVRRHNPAANWMGTGTNQIPAITNQPFTAFPSNFDSLPTVCYVIPTLAHDMHDGTIADGDTWFHDHIDPYVQWAKTHNSLLIFTYDEDDGILISSNHILTVFAGQSVAAGQYSDAITHYYVLRTIEEMYGLPYICNAASAATITQCWMTTAAHPRTQGAGPQLAIYPNPSIGKVTIEFTDYLHSKVDIMDVNGKLLYAAPLTGPKTDLALEGWAAGLYLVKVTHPKGVATQRLLRE